MAQKYSIQRANEVNLRSQIMRNLDSLSERIGGPDDPDDPANPYLGGPALRKGTANLEWIPGTYYDGGTVRDENWAMVANKTTQDRPAPQPTGVPSWLLPDTPTWDIQSYTGVVFSGIRVVPPQDQLYQITSMRVWIQDTSATAVYRIITVDNISGIVDIGTTFTGDIVPSPQWVDLTINPTFVNAADDFSVILQVSNVSATTDFDFDWVYTGTSQTQADPGTGNWNRDNQQSIIRINNTDADAGDRSAQLASVIPGTTIRIVDQTDANAWWEYSVLDTLDLTTYFGYSVLLVNTGAAGGPGILNECDIFFQVPVPASIDYVRIIDGYLNDTEVSGQFGLDDIDNIVTDDNAYGVDIQYQQYTASEDWNILAYSGGGTSSGGVASALAFSALAEGWVLNPTWWARWTQQERENLHQLTRRVPWPGSLGIPTLDESERGARLRAYMCNSAINTHDPVVILGMLWLESIFVLPAGRAAIILAG